MKPLEQKHDASTLGTPPIDSRQNILLVGNWRSDTGYAWNMIERFWIAIADAFPNCRVLLCFPELGAVNPAIIAAGIEVFEFSFDFKTPAAIVKFCRTHKIGMIYFTDRPYTSPVYPLLRLSGVQNIIVHDHTPGSRTTPMGIKRIAKSIISRMFGADAYIACSEHVLARLTEVGCLSAEKCHLARNGIDLSRFDDTPSSIRKELDLPSDATLVVSCSRVHPYKRIDDIVDAAAFLNDSTIHFIHIGDGPGFPALQKKIDSFYLNDRFTLLGQRHDVPQILSGCDIAVHASDGEVGLCLAILEFMASHLPVLVTDEPSVCRALTPGQNGLTYPHRDVRALAAQIRLLSQDAQLRKRLGNAARRTVDPLYRIENTISAVVDILQRLCRNSSTPPTTARPLRTQDDVGTHRDR